MRHVVSLTSAIVIAAIVGPASAQQATPQEAFQALQGKLQDEINQDMQVRALLVKTQDELATAQKEIADLQKQIDALKVAPPKEPAPKAN